jgi:hypothetical protein
MDRARGCLNLCVIMRVDVVHQEIDQPAPCLQYRQKAAVRSYYMGLETSMPAIRCYKPPLKALCVIPQGMLRWFGFRSFSTKSAGSFACHLMSASLIGRLRSSTFRLSATGMSMSLTGSRFSSESAPGSLYGASFVKKFGSAAHVFLRQFLCSI